MGHGHNLDSETVNFSKKNHEKEKKYIACILNVRMTNSPSSMFLDSAKATEQPNSV